MKGLADIIQQWVNERDTLANADARMLAELKQWALYADNVFALEDFAKGGKAK